MAMAKVEQKMPQNEVYKANLTGLASFHKIIIEA
jgi:hypothetical protein